MDIKNSSILITSAGSLLGRTLASHFAQLGAMTMLCDHRQEQLNVTYQHLRSFTNRVARFHVQGFDNCNVADLFDAIDEHQGQAPDVLVNCWTSSPMPALSDSRSSHTYMEKLTNTASNLLNYGQVCSERMKREDRRGVIVNVMSHGDHQNFSGVESVTSLVSGFTHSWARELNPFNIRVGGVVPSLSKNQTGTVEAAHWAEVQDELIRNTEYIVSNEYFSGRVVTAEV